MPPSQAEMAYAVHTLTCTYLLDEDGICRWIVSNKGTVPGHIQQCIGAQFVACLDLSVRGGLTGNLNPGGMALFVKHTGKKMVLLRTGAIEHVDDRRSLAASHDEPAPPPAAIREAPPAYGKVAGVPRRDPNAPSFGVVKYEGEEQTITVNVPEAETSRQLSPQDYVQAAAQLLPPPVAPPRRTLPGGSHRPSSVPPPPRRSSVPPPPPRRSSVPPPPPRRSSVPAPPGVPVRASDSVPPPPPVPAPIPPPPAAPFGGDRPGVPVSHSDSVPPPPAIPAPRVPGSSPPQSRPLPPTAPFPDEWDEDWDLDPIEAATQRRNGK